MLSLHQGEPKGVWTTGKTAAHVDFSLVPFLEDFSEWAWGEVRFRSMGGDEGKKVRRQLSTGAGVYCHIGVDFEHHVFVLVEEEDAQRGHLLRDAARLWNAWDHTHCTDYALDGGVVRRLQGLNQTWMKGQVNG